MKKIYFLLLSLFLMTTLVTPAHAQIADLKLISQSPLGVVGDSDSAGPVLSGNGLFIVFDSEATNLISGDTNDVGDIYLYSIADETVERVSVADNESEANQASYSPVVSDNGRYVVFTSSATNLVTGDVNGFDNIFIRDTQLDTTELVDTTYDDDFPSDEASGYPSMSSDGRYIAFTSYATDVVEDDTNEAGDVFVRDTLLDVTERVSLTSLDGEGDAGSFGSVISNDGRYVVFQSAATNLVPGDTNGVEDVFLRDRTLGTTEIISVDSSENLSVTNSYSSVPNSMISDNGRYVIFGANGDDLVDNDSNGVSDVFLRDRTLGTTEIISVSSTGVQADSYTTVGSISPDGRYISFGSGSDLLVPNDGTSDEDLLDIFIRDTFLDKTKRVSLSLEGIESDGYSESVGTFSSGGRYITYYSAATNLTDDTVPADTYQVYYGEITDDDGIVSSVEDDAPNAGDIDENDYDDAIEENITSFFNSISNNYTSVKTTGDCTSNSDFSSVAESSLASQDESYDYPAGITTFHVECKDDGQTAMVTLYYFYDGLDADSITVRKFNEDSNTYTTIDSATVEATTINGEPVIKIEYSVTDGDTLDEDGLENGSISDPVGLGVVASGGNSGGSSSGSRARQRIAQNTLPQTLAVCTPFITLMKLGSKYGEVKKLQESLTTFGFQPGVADGLFGPKTNAAVKAFQSKYKLTTDGIVGPLTRAALARACKVS